jgi:integrase
VYEPFPDLAKTRASEVGPLDVQRILARMVKAGITRQVNVTRSYLKAAFTWGAAADYSPERGASEGVVFGLGSNPVLSARNKDYDRVGKRALNEDELRAYWNALEALPPVQRSTLRFNLAIAGQRPTQLLRADSGAFDWNLIVEDYSGPTLSLRDSKGKGEARAHLLPLTAFALEQLKPLRERNGEAQYLFSADGKTPMVVETLSNAVSEISAALTKEAQIPKFDQRDIRRTVETRLQKLGIDKEVRAHLLSHGRTKGVQGKVYEQWDFLTEKLAALEKWGRYLERIISGESAKVVPLRAA